MKLLALKIDKLLTLGSLTVLLLLTPCVLTLDLISHSSDVGKTDEHREYDNIRTDFHNLRTQYTAVIATDDILQTLSAAGARTKSLSLYGRSTTLQELLDYSGVTGMTAEIAQDKFWPLFLYDQKYLSNVHDVNPHKTDLKTRCDGLPYIQRLYTDSTILETDSPADLTHFLNDKSNNDVILIVGDKGSGKSVALTKILTNLRETSNSWTLAVDLEEAVPKILPQDWTPQDIFRTVLGPEQSQLFQDILQYNPSKINILLDNFDRVSNTPAGQLILDFLEKINKKGAGIVITSTNTPESLIEKPWKVNINKIPELLPPEIATYLINRWNVELTLSNKYRQTTYAEAIAITMEKISIPRTFGIIKKISELLTKTNENIFRNSHLMTVQDYAAHMPSTSPVELMTMINNVKLNKMELFDWFLATSSINSQAANEFLGSWAFENIIHHDKLPTTPPFATLQLDYIYYENDRLKFFHPEYELYYAAKHLINQLNTQSKQLPIDCVIELLEKPKFVGLVEYLNAEISQNGANKLKNIITTIHNSPGIFQKVMDNLIVHGFDSIAGAIIEPLYSANLIGYYFETTVNTKTSIKSNTRYNFGLLTTVEKFVQCNRQEMMIRMNMEKMIDAVVTVQNNRNVHSKYLWHMKDMKMYLEDIVLSQCRPSIKIYQVLMERIVEKDVVFLNKLLCKTVAHAGINGRPIVDDLIKRGADVKTANIDGKNLVHLAIQKSDPVLLGFLVEELKLPILDSSVLIEALDSNPFPRFSRPQFWEMMYYIVSHGNIEIPKIKSRKLTFFNVKSKPGDKSSAFWILLAGSRDNIEISSYTMNPRLKFFEPHTTDLSDKMLNLRRNLVLQESNRQFTLSIFNQHQFVLLTEILLKYRGLDKLEVIEEEYFSRAIEAALQYDMKHTQLTSRLLKRLAQGIYENIGTLEDLNFMEKLLRHNILPHLNQAQVVTLVNRVVKSLTNKKPNSPQGRSNLKTRVLQSKSQLHTTLPIDLADVPTVWESLIEISSEPRPLDYINLFDCSSNRRKRGVTSCRLSHRDIEHFLDVRGGDKVTINTEKFVFMIAEAETLKDSKKSKQLIAVAQELVEMYDISLSGDYTSVFTQILEAGGLENSQNSRNMRQLLSRYVDSVKKSFTGLIRVHGESTSTSMIYFVPMIESAIHIKKICESGDEAACRKAAIFLAMALGMFIVQPIAPKIVIWSVGYKINAELSKLSTPLLMQNLHEVTELKMLRQMRVEKAMIWLGRVMTLIGVGFEAYTIYELATQLNTCLQYGCPLEMRITVILGIVMASIRILTIIALYLLPINPIIGGLIFLDLWLVEKMLNLVVDYTIFAIQYQPNMLESIDHLLGKIGLGDQVFSDILQRTHIAIRYTNENAANILQTHPNIIAVAMPIGVLSPNAKNISRSSCFIDLRSENHNNTINLARVIPKEIPGTIRLCLPKFDVPKIINMNQGVPIVESAVYNCAGALVIGNKTEWNRRKIHNPGTVLFQLDTAYSAHVYGHNKYDNFFIINHLTVESKIFGGKLSNSYQISNAADTTIVFNSASMRETIILSESRHLKVMLKFFFNGTDIVGQLVFHAVMTHRCLLKWDNAWKSMPSGKSARIFAINGRPNRPDDIQCADSEMLHQLESKYLFVADGGGGSLLESDLIYNCHHAILHPFTNYVVTNANNNVTYTFYAEFTGYNSFLNVNSNRTVVHTSIELKNDATALLTFDTRPLYKQIISMTYSPRENLLTWDLIWSEQSVLNLKIRGYYSNLSYFDDETVRKMNNTPDDDDLRHKMASIRFYDRYTGGSLVPIINLNEKKDLIVIKDFSLTVKTKISNLKEATSIYYQIISVKNSTINMDIQLICAETEDIYYYGRSNSDMIYIDEKMKFAAGLDGPDYYTLMPTSPEYIWINNEAVDGQLDSLIVPDGLCDYLTIKNMSKNLSPVININFDVVVMCWSKNSSLRINVVLQNYWIEKRYQHLSILWRQVTYIIMPKFIEIFLSNVDYLVPLEEHNQLSIVEFISMHNSESTAIINVDSNEPFCLVYVSDVNETWEASIDRGTDVLLTLSGATTTIRLNNFYVDKQVSSEWTDKIFVIVDDLFDEHAHLNHLDSESITDLLVKNRDKQLSTLYKLAESTYVLGEHQEGNLSISHNDSTAIPGPRWAVLRVTNAKPNETHAHWDKELWICAKELCAIVENWCKSRGNRLNSIVFQTHMNYQPIIIRDIDELECAQDGGSEAKLIESLNNFFTMAQRLLELSRPINIDSERFIFCISIFYAENVTTIPVFLLFDFDNMYSQGHFVFDDCKTVVTEERFFNLTLENVREVIENSIKKFEVKRMLETRYRQWTDADRVIDAIRRSFHDYDDWFSFLKMAYNIFFPNKPEVNFKRIDSIRKHEFSQLPWYEKTARYLQQC